MTELRLELNKEYTDEEVNGLGLFLRCNVVNGHPAYIDDAGTEGYILKRNKMGKLEVEVRWTYCMESKK